MLVADTTKRLGCSKGGVSDIYNHRLWKDMDWESLIKMNITAPHIPKIKYHQI